MTSDVKHCQATPTWTITVPAHFAEVDNGDSWQCHADTRTIYVSSMKVANGSSPVPATALRDLAARKLGQPREVERLQFVGSGVEGDAQITTTGTGFELKGFACVDGGVATCVISFEQLTDRDWAVDTWQSLRPISVAKPRAWWRIW